MESAVCVKWSGFPLQSSGPSAQDCQCPPFANKYSPSSLRSSWGCLPCLFKKNYLWILEREGREGEGNINLLFHLFMHSLVNSCLCLIGVKPTALEYGDNALTNWSTQPGWLSLTFVLPFPITYHTAPVPLITHCCLWVVFVVVLALLYCEILEASDSKLFAFLYFGFCFVVGFLI